MTTPEGGGGPPTPILLKRDPPVANPLVRLFTPLVAWGYRIAISRINRRYDARRGVVELDRPVVSVGNLSMGGTGKTPMVMHLIEWLREAGHDPAVAMRGYGAPRGRGGESDEARTYTSRFPDVPVVARADRVEGLIELFSSERGEGVDCVVLDDGFQHRRLARDLDVVLLDLTSDVFEDRLLPEGWLREPVSSLSRAGAVVLTHAESATRTLVERSLERVGGVAPGACLAVCRHAWTSLRVSEGGVEREEGVSWLSGRGVATCCAIGNPRAFMMGVREAAGGDPQAWMILRDHDPYSERTIRAIVDMLVRTRAGALVVTEKDWAKLSRVAAGTWPCPVARPVLALRFDRGEEELRARVLGVVGARAGAQGEA